PRQSVDDAAQPRQLSGHFLVDPVDVARRRGHRAGLGGEDPAGHVIPPDVGCSMYLVFPVGRDPVPGRHMIGRAPAPIGSIFFPPLPLPPSPSTAVAAGPSTFGPQSSHLLLHSPLAPSGHSPRTTAAVRSAWPHTGRSC